MPATFTDFREDFQDLLLACMMREPERFTFLASAVKPKYFTGVQPTLAARCMLEHFEKYLRYPAWEVLEQRLDEATRQLPESEGGLAIDYVRKLRRMDVGDWEFVRDHVSDFVRERALVDAIRQSVTMLQDGKVPPDGFTSLFAKAMQVGRDLDDLGYMMHEDVDRVISKVMNVEYGLKTGFPKLDSIWKNGWAPGWLVVPAAPPKRYKSGFCINLALNVVSPAVGKDVIYYACELNQEVAMVRAMCHLARLPEDTLYESSMKFSDKVKEAMQESIAARLLFKSFPSKTATIADLRAHARMATAQLNMKPRLIIIDYAETIQPSDRKEKEYRQQSSIYTEARAFASEIGATVVMPDRVKQEFVDQAVPNMRALQGAFEKAGIVDIAFGLCATDMEYIERCIRLFVFLNRHGPAYQHFRGSVDPVTWHLEFNQAIPYDVSAVDSETEGRARSRRGARMPRELVEQ